MKFLATKFAQVNANISETQAQIAALQTKLSELQDYHQHLLLVEQACESVLAQMETALAMLNNVDPTQIAIFKAAIELNFTLETINIFEPTAPIETATPEPTTHTEPEVSIEQEIEPTINTPLETDVP
jgi:TolA-binding protein